MSSHKPGVISYAQSGVSIDAGNEFVRRIKPLAKQTRQQGVVSPIGGFAGLFRPEWRKFADPLLVACTDGVGTKLKIALTLNQFDTIGQDLVAMCVNDLICIGAEPLFFLDYFAMAKLDVEQGVSLMQGITRALAQCHCALLGGETAEMPGIYAPGDLDLAGFAVGIVDGQRTIDGTEIQPGDRLIGLQSSGFHSNGYSLVRKIVADKKLDLGADALDLGRPLGQVLLEPTTLYVKSVLETLKHRGIKGMAHITGGGLIENIPRVLPAGLTIKLDHQAIPVPEVMKRFEQIGPITEHEMWRVFNMGIGFVLIVSPTEVDHIIPTVGHGARVIGEVVKGS